MKWFKRVAVGVVVVAVLAYGAGLAGMYFLQRDFQYDRSGRMFELSETALKEAQLVSIPSADGSPLAAWFQPPQAAMPVVMYFRGNAQSFSREHERYEAFVADGYGFLAFDYRGFPGSPGEVTEANVLADSEAAFDWLKAKGFPILLWGRSLGSGPSTWIASTPGYHRPSGVWPSPYTVTSGCASGSRCSRGSAVIGITPFDMAIAAVALRFLSSSSPRPSM